MIARSTSTSRGFLVGSLLVVALAIGACSAPSGAPTPAPSQPAPSQPAPSQPAPSQPAPSQPTGGLSVDLDVIGGDSVTVDIVDEPGIVVGARKGALGEGASVPESTLDIVNLDDRTLQLTWVDYPVDRELELHILNGGATFVLIQPDLDEPSDSIVFDRQLILEFAEPIDADAIEGFVQGGWDTAA